MEAAIAAPVTGLQAVDGHAPRDECDAHCGLVSKVDMIASVVGVGNKDNPLALDSPAYENTVVGMLIRSRRDWKMVKAIGITIIVMLVIMAVYIQTHSPKEVRDMAGQILALKAFVEGNLPLQQKKLTQNE